MSCSEVRSEIYLLLGWRFITVFTRVFRFSTLTIFGYLLFTPWSFKVCLRSEFLTKILYNFLVSVMYSTFHGHLMLLALFTQIIPVEGYKSLRSSLCQFCHPPAPSSGWGPSVLPGAPVAGTPAHGLRSWERTAFAGLSVSDFAADVSLSAWCDAASQGDIYPKLRDYVVVSSSRL
jgi:hypothetical protein